MRRQNKEDEIRLFSGVPCPDNLEAMDYILKALQYADICLTGTMLEAGCGDGANGIYLMDFYPELSVIGKDLVRQDIKHPRYEFRKGDLEKPIFPVKSFDSILCFGTLHHFPDMGIVFNNFYHWLKPGGIMIIFEPNGTNPINKLSWCFRKFLEWWLGTEWLLDNYIATSNETGHSYEKYLKYINKRLLKVVHLGFYNSRFPYTDIRNWTKGMLHKLIPNSRYSADMLLFIARKE